MGQEAAWPLSGARPRRPRGSRTELGLAAVTQRSAGERLQEAGKRGTSLQTARGWGPLGSPASTPPRPAPPAPLRGPGRCFPLVSAARSAGCCEPQPLRSSSTCSRRETPGKASALLLLFESWKRFFFSSPKPRRISTLSMRDSIGLRKGSQAVLGRPHSLFRPPQGQRQGRRSPLLGLGQTPAPSARSLAGALASSARSGAGSLPGKGGIVLFPGKCVGPGRCPGSWEAQILSVPPPPPPFLHITVPGVPGGLRASARRPPKKVPRWTACWARASQIPKA